MYIEKVITELDPKTGQMAEYKIGERLGGGRITNVYLADQIYPHEEINHTVAVKIANSASQNSRLEDERKLLTDMAGQPAFPRLEGYGRTDQADGESPIFLVLELVEGEPLISLARKSPDQRLDERVAIRAGLQYAQMLRELHNKKKFGYASLDRKINDIYWDNPETLEPRLIVLDWNVAASFSEEDKYKDIRQFALFWY